MPAPVARGAATGDLSPARTGARALPPARRSRADRDREHLPVCCPGQLPGVVGRLRSFVVDEHHAVADEDTFAYRHP